MADLWLWFFQRKEIITFCIALIGFVLSCANTLYLLWCNQRRVKILWKSVRIAENMSGHPIDFEVVVENHSTQPISLSRVFLVADSHRYEFAWMPTVCFTSKLKQGREVIHQQVITSLQLPILLQGLGAVGGFLYVETSETFTLDMLKSNSIYIEFWTSRGKIKSTLPLSIFDVDD